MPSLPEIKHIHEELLILLKKFDEICRAHDIRYSLHGGTLLGAVREHGFIPWDDDADIMLTRADYEKFCAVMKSEPLDPDFSFKEFASQHPRFRMKREGKVGVWVDLFIFDYISENRLVQKMKILMCCFLLAFTKSKSSMKITLSRGQHKGLRLLLLKVGYTMGRPFSAKFKTRVMNFCNKHLFTGRKKLIHRANDQYWAMKLIHPREVMETYCDMDYEGHPLMLTSRHHEVLTALYGKDYMTPKRERGHEAFDDQ